MTWEKLTRFESLIYESFIILITILIGPCYSDLSLKCNCVRLNTPNQDGAYSGPAWCIFALKTQRFALV